MTNLSVDSRDTVLKPTPSETKSELEPLEVLITFTDGARFQFRILIPQSISDSDKSITQRDSELASWFSAQAILPAHEFSRNGHTPDLCVSESATFINMANVSQIREMPR